MKSLFDILFTSCYFTCTWLVLEISLFGSIAVNIVVKVFHIWHSDPYMDRLPSRESSSGVMADKKQFSNTKSIVKVETGIVILISYRHYLKIVGNNKWWPHAKRKLKYSQNEILLHYGEWDRIVTLTGEQADWELRYRI
jgi:hypothetical protein